MSKSINFLKKGVSVTTNKSSAIFQVGKQTETTQSVAEFYKVAPFPNYNDFQTKADLNAIIEANKFIKELKKKLGFGKSIIEVGSGTSQLSLALAIGTNNEVVAFDPTVESLELGENFAKTNGINNVTFVNGDLFEDPITKRYFDLVWCSGVLHHTQNSEAGFNIISQWVKEDGIIVVGLYNKYGRLRTNFRQFLFKLIGGGPLARNLVLWLDPYLRKPISTAKKEAWIRDQYEHPVERKHTIDEVLNWFENNGIAFLGAIPGPTSESVYSSLDDMNGETGTFMSRLVAQISMLFNNLGGEGGLFIVVGKKS